MSLPLIWMADVLRAAGCIVIETPDWKTRGRPRSFGPFGIMLHHDASPEGETASGWEVIAYGHADLEGPVGNLWLAYDGTWYCIAAGSANHAGEGDGSWGDIDDGNHDTIGIETDHTTNELWSSGQRSEGLRGVDALRRHMGMTDAQVGRRVLAHKEWAPSRKVDPDPLNMTTARANLIAYEPNAEDGFVEQIRRSSSQEQSISAGKWTKVRMAEDTFDGSKFAIITGPRHFVLSCAITTDPVPAGKSLMLRAVNTGDDPDTAVASHPIEQYGPTDAGAQHFSHFSQGWVDDGQWLRVQISTDAAVRITKSETRVTTW